MLRTLLHDGAAYAVPGIVGRGLGFVLIPLYTRVLSPVEYGTFDLFMVFASLAHLTVALEISQAVARFYQEASPEDRRSIASTAWWFTVIAYTAFGIVAATSAADLSPSIMGRVGMEREFAIGIVAIWTHGVLHLAQSLFRWQLRTGSYVAASLLSIVGGTLVAVALTYGMRLGIGGLLIGQSIGSIAALTYTLYALRGTLTFNFDVGVLRRLLAFSTPLVPAAIAVFLTAYADRYVLAHLAGIDAVGVYGIALRFASVVGVMVGSLQQALMPLIYAHHAHPETPGQLARTLRLFVGGFSVLAVTLTVAAPSLLAVLTTEAYSGAAAPMGPLIGATILGQMYVFGPGLLLAKRTKTVFAIKVVGAILNLGLNFLFIPWWGLVGAATATLASQAAVFGLTMTNSHRWFPVEHRWWPLGLAGAATVPIVILANHLLAMGVPSVGIVLAAGALQLLVVVSLRVVEFGDVRAVWRRVRPPQRRP